MSHCKHVGTEDDFHGNMSHLHEGPESPESVTQVSTQAGVGKLDLRVSVDREAGDEPREGSRELISFQLY